MRRNKHWEKEKDLLSLFLRRYELEEIKRNFPLVELETPYRRGWFITATLRQDFARSKYAEVYQELIDVGILVGYTTRNVKLIKEARNSKSTDLETQERGNYNSYHLPRFKKLSPKEFSKLKPQLQKHFRRCYEYDRYYYVLNLPHYMFRLKVNPNIITHEKLLDGDVLSELNWIDTKIFQLNGWSRWYGRGSNYYHGIQSYNRHNKEFKKLLKQEIDGLYSNNCED